VWIQRGNLWLPGLYDLRTFRFEFPMSFRKQASRSK
jgi:hypothetical protein